MGREEAVAISAEESIKLSTIDEVIRYLMECYHKGINVYCDWHGETRLYSCDGYTYDEYYLLATGLTIEERKHLDAIVFAEDKSLDDKIKLNNLILPVYSYLKEIHAAKREELKEGREQKTM